MILPVLASMMLTCEQFDWLKEGVFRSELLTTSEKLDFIFRFADGTDSGCFNIADPQDAND